ncbi:MAG: ABC-F family ATP-binding cassette domain-containing protein [Turicibacter sanguinis]|jgi:ABC transporter, ATP-binding protein|uniref:ATP-binding cassette domain-containing protein n=2 Tax=Turicibacter sanguinis TaxID=154288 RepID=A0A9X5AP72_9FIRM|nr:MULTISPECIES: ABC-F family ATP-binding cassette domain-containing protein [Turicibacter]EFF64964.1 ABC transporter, ATP-binding protein [Turicibacter sanguinis PC909]EGC93374.1 ABC transporter, ATP-binding protein [Turicibacter sp. HGF1]MBP3905313.1 ABC-F family ATP-binding cassette domain-containing protein [Turicibacter sp.]MCU7191675.1 ABC-F family ATP-binding cassette domain-containing protein [Turicibacter sanguinis]MCU7197224.1 ABC-F family ATP-binding cassette domain-containing prote
MILLQTSKLTKLYSGTPILENVQFEVKKGERIAVVGRNGAGKSTLLKMIADEIDFDSGEIHKPQSVILGYFAQSSHVNSDDTIYNEMLKVFSKTLQLKKQLEELSLKMAEIDPTTEAYLKIIEQYQNMNHQFELMSGYTYEAEINNILNRFKFNEIGFDQKISNLSGGQKTRLALAKLLLQKPDILILDEPTNHLDIDTIEWLEGYLKKYSGAVVIVSHDRFFIDQIATTIYEIEYRKCTKYKGNYSDYIDQKAVAYSSLMKQYEKQQKEISKMEDFISRNIVRASTTKQAQSRRKKLEKMERIEIPKINDKSIGITFEIDRRSGNDVLKVENLSVGYDNQVITDDLNFQINRLDRVALIGPNGIGKSTILKTVAQTLPPLKGDIYYGKSLDMGYFDQEQANLNSSNTVLNEVWNCFPGRLEKDIRTLLGNFLFTGDDVFKTVNQLSGGEKVRLTLCKLMLEKNNFLLLDEPTNHLDIDSKEMLELSLEDYEGTVFFISHDRYFIDKIATRVLEVTPHGVTSYIGNYSDYTEKKQQLAEKEAALQAENSKKNDEPTITDYQKQKEQRRLEQQRKRQLEDIETKISEYEEELAYNQAELFKEEVYLDTQKSAEVQSRIEELEQLLADAMETWESLA